MKNDMAEYLNALASGNFDTFEQIISLQYRKFVRFYKLVKQYSRSIDKLKYHFHDAESLDVVLNMESGSDMKDIKKELESSMERNGYDGSIKIQKNNLHISIVLAEVN